MKTAQGNQLNHKTPLLFIGIFIVLGLIAGLIWLFIFVLQHPLTETGIFQNWFLKSLMLFSIGLMIILLVTWPIGVITGIFKGRRQVITEEKALKSINPNQFYKELPNNYGIGIASLLFNSTIENEKDIIAVILDLCAQKYLHLSKHSDRYVIRILPTTKTPLSNEAYVLDLIRTNNLKNINYQKWYQLCVQDGVKFGLYHPIGTELLQPPSPQTAFKFPKVCRLLAILSAIAAIASLFLKAPNSFILFIILSLTFLVAGAVILYFKAVFSGTHRVAKEIQHLNDKVYLENHLIKTPKGATELQKLYAFKNFLAQFNTFVDKDPEAVILWDRYLSYAQVFGLAKEIMNSGYSQLIDNVAFKIDNIDAISLPNLRVDSPAHQ